MLFVQEKLTLQVPLTTSSVFVYSQPMTQAYLPLFWTLSSNCQTEIRWKPCYYKSAKLLTTVIASEQ